MKFRRQKCLLIILSVCALLLAGCGAGSSGETQDAIVTSAPETQRYTVRFHYRGQMVYEEQVNAGEAPELMPTCAEPNYIADGWVDAAGNAVDPQTAAVQGDCDYTAVVYPAFTNHVPYLFTDENGYIRPDAVLTGAELASALQVLVADPEALTTVTMPAEDAELTKTDLQELFAAFFPAKKLENAMFNIPEGKITRSDFASLMNTLLDRFATETLLLEEGQALPKDLALHRADTDDVLEAVLAHTAAEDGRKILDAVMDMQWEPGFTNLAGWLYYADENGVLLRSGQVGTLTFGADGRYTSGDAQLDEIVAENLNAFIAETPSDDRFEILYTAFLHCRDDYKYVGRGLLEAGETGWEIEWAKQMFHSGAGNCYSYAAIFWAYARGLGYDAYCVSGWTTEEYDPHGWVEIEMEEGLRIFDPELAMAYLRDGKNYEAVFNMEYALAVQWPYFWP